MMVRERILSVTIHDCEVQTFRAGGPGGQNQNKRDTGVRVIHHASGARGEAREERSQLQNKKLAFRRMATSSQFNLWLRLETGRAAALEASLAEIQRSANFHIDPLDVRVEVRVDGRWVEAVGPLL